MPVSAEPSCQLQHVEILNSVEYEAYTFTVAFSPANYIAGPKDNWVLYLKKKKKQSQLPPARAFAGSVC